ncbi:MAG: hypothetical protein NVSMB3_14880 [Acidobacteriaceae bacterium]
MLVLAGVLVGWGGGVTAHEWRTQVPERARMRVSPEAEGEDGSKAGAKIFAERCSSCHGAEAVGRGRRPSLRTERVRGAADGELMWLLENGELRYGMPSWSALPEEQRWQVIRYLRSLPEEAGANGR